MSSARYRVVGPRPSHPRTTTGCLCCRLRRKKCDESRPVCNGCDRNRLICTWPHRAIVDRKSTEFGWKLRLNAGERFHSLDEGITLIPTEDFPKTVRESDKGIPLPLTPGSFQNGFVTKDPNSYLLFQHYQAVTAQHLPVAMWIDNPFVTFILPLAHSHDLIMHGVLAMSGAHLSHSSTSMQIKAASLTHYALAVRGVKHELTKKLNGEDVDTLHLLLAILLLCQVERISGNLEGTIFHHLRASRAIILLELRVEDDKADKMLKGFLLELYAYLALVGNITIESGLGKRAINLDPFLFSLDSLAGYPTFGCMFGCASELFEIIPSICLLGRDRLLKSKQKEKDPTLKKYQALQAKIENWQPPINLEYGTEENRQLVLAARIYQQGLLIFLHASFFAYQKDDFSHSLEVEHISNNMFELLDAVSSKAASTILWPIIILGSCLHLPERQRKLRTILSTSVFQMTSLTRAIQLLDWLWDDPTAFGPQGLDIVMKTHKVNFCMA